jgi:hypothetical protein
MRRFFAAIRDWITEHKKATAAMAGALVELIPTRYASDAAKQQITILVVAFIAAQGIADHGKERAKIDAAATNSGTTIIESDVEINNGPRPSRMTDTSELDTDPPVLVKP